MNKPTTKAWVSTKRKRNFIAKKLLTDPQFKPKVTRKKPKEDRKNLDDWLMCWPDGDHTY